MRVHTCKKDLVKIKLDERGRKRRRERDRARRWERERQIVGIIERKSARESS